MRSAGTAPPPHASPAAPPAGTSGGESPARGHRPSGRSPRETPVVPPHRATRLGRTARRALNGAADPLVGATAANVAVHRRVDLLASGPWVRREQGRRLHDLSRLAVSTLRHLLRYPRPLHRVAAVDRESLDC